MAKYKTLYVDVADVLGILQNSVAQGMSIEALLKDLELPPDLLDDPEAQIDMEDCWHIINAHLNVIQDETHMMSTRPLKRGTTRFVFSHLQHCANLHEGLELLADTYNIVHGGNYNFVRKRGDVLSYIVDDSEFHYRDKANDFAIEFALINIHCALSVMCGQALKLVKMASKRKRILHQNHHLNFFDCPVVLGHGHYEIAYDAVQENTAFVPLENHDLLANLYASYVAILRRGQQDVYENTLVKKVLNCIRRGQHRQSQVASVLGVSVSTLRRKLAQQGVSFRALLDKVNSEMAINDLHQGVAIADIAEELGYCDLRSFKRAFVRWQGVSPAAYVRKNLSQKQR